MLRLSSIVLALAAALFVPDQSAHAQCAVVPGTGCAGAPPLVCLGPPKLGQLAQVSYAAPGLVIAGLFAGAPLITLPFGLGCVPGCVLAGQPLYTVGGVGAAQLIFMVPNNPGFVGLSYFGQAVYLPNYPAQSCLMASNALRGTIVP